MTTKDKILNKPVVKKNHAPVIASPTATPPAPQAEEPKVVQATPQTPAMTNVTTAVKDDNVVGHNVLPKEDAEMRNRQMWRDYVMSGGQTPEEREKQKRSRAASKIFAAIGDGLSALSNLHYTTQYAPNVEQRSGVQYLTDKWKGEDDERRDNFLKGTSLYQQMQAAKRAEDELKYRRDRDALANKRYEEEKKYRAKKDAEAKAAQERAEQWAKEEFNKEQEATNKRHEATLKNQRDIAYIKEHDSGDKGTTDIILTDSETLKIPNRVLKEAANISTIYNALPEHLKQQAIERYATKDGKPTIDFKTGKEVQKYKPMTAQQMRQAIGDFLSDSDAVDAQNIARRLAGQEVVQSTKDEEIVDYTPNGMNGQNEPNEITEVIDYTPKASAKQNGEPIVIQPTPKVSTWNPAKAQRNAQKAKEENEKRVKAASRLNILERNK